MDPQALLKKLVRIEKRMNLKRAKLTTEENKQDDEEEETPEPKEQKVNKSELKAKIEKNEYDLSLHFSSKAVHQLESASKARSFVVVE